MTRLARYGHGVDTGVSIPFTFDGKPYCGHPGDTLASALQANGVRVMGRSFKYHRPRGVLSADSTEPNALMEIGTGAERLPNTRATTQELFEGLSARSQNRWPSLGWDVMALNDMLSPFFGAGFYYKTFMWPASFWEKLYEPLIRRAAGLGRLSGLPDPARYDKATAHCDLLVIGAGPAGLMAALTAGRAGKRVILAEEEPLVGGRLNGEAIEIGGHSGLDWASGIRDELQSLPNVTLMLRTTVTGAYDGGTYGALQRVADHVPNPAEAPRQTFWNIVARHALLTSGAHERMIAFANNDRPGVMLGSAVRTYLHRFGVVPGQRVAVFTNNNDGWRTARDLLDAGVTVTALIDTRADAVPDLDCPVMTGAQVVNTAGRLGLERLTVAHSDGSRTQVNANVLAVSGGWNPALHLGSHMGARPVWRDDIAAFVPAGDGVPGLRAAGAAHGDFSTHAALQNGAQLAADLFGQDLPDIPQAEDAPTTITPFWHVAGKRAWLDFQNDVTVKDVQLAHRENFRSVEHMKRYTTLGMATDQGKHANVPALAIMAELTGQSISDTGTTIYRPPYTPVQIGALAGRQKGAHFAPERRSPAHAVALKAGAKWVDAGLWKRASLFPARDEKYWRQTCDREVLMVRNNVGVCDVSTLGKIEVLGPDALTLLDRVYATGLATLAQNRVRYALMLREDGLVMDDGTVTRLGQAHYLLSTTTGAAGQVLSHLEFCAQCLWPELDVQIAAVSDQWAQFAIAGPKARTALEGLLDGAVDLPFMGYAPVRIGGVDARLFRISYSGELGYELAVPARFGAALFATLIKRVASLGGGAYGLEALNVLRIEKGFLTHAEIDGRVTLDDLGFGRMGAAKEDFIGQEMAHRPGLGGLQLVGVKPAGVVRQLTGGALLFDLEDAPVRENMRGHTTSVAFSPVLGHMIGLALLQDGRARIGEQLRMVDHVRDVTTICEVVSPVFIEQTGGQGNG